MTYQTRLPRIAAELDPRVEAAISAAAEQIAKGAKTRVPVDTGKLRDAIHVEQTGLDEFSVIAGAEGVFYGHIVEHGGALTPAQPFMIPALEANRGQIGKILKAAMVNL